MELTAKQKKTQEIIQKVFLQAWEDADFKQQLIANPVEVIERVTGERIQLPEGKTLIVKDQTDDTNIYINIPAEPKMEDFELSESQLETIAGGGDLWSIPTLPNLPIDPDKDGY